MHSQSGAATPTVGLSRFLHLEERPWTLTPPSMPHRAGQPRTHVVSVDWPLVGASQEREHMCGLLPSGPRVQDPPTPSRGSEFLVRSSGAPRCGQATCARPVCVVCQRFPRAGGPSYLRKCPRKQRTQFKFGGVQFTFCLFLVLLVSFDKPLPNPGSQGSLPYFFPKNCIVLALYLGVGPFWASVCVRFHIGISLVSARC